MGDKRITVKELIAWLATLPQEAQVCVVTPGMVPGTARELREITLRPCGGPAPDELSLVILGVAS